MTDYITLPIPTDPEQIALDAFNAFRALFPGWTPYAGEPDVIIIESLSRPAAVAGERASAAATDIFRFYGSLVGVEPVNGTGATAQTTWTMQDTAGYTIPAGTQVGVRAAGDELVPFRVQAAVTVPAGSSVTAAGEVAIVAVEPGVGGSGLGSVGGPVELIDQLAFVTAITLTAPTSGGVDAESDAVYLGRLSARLRLLTPRPILPRDFEALARDIAGVDRALAIDGYDPVAVTSGNDRTIAVYAIDADGNAVSTAIKNAIDAYLQSLREVNFLVFVADPAYTNVDVTYTAAAVAGYSTGDVQARAATALASYLSPANWGRTGVGQDDHQWVNQTVVRYLEVAQVINQVEGVDYVSALTIGLNGGAQTAADHTLTGVAPLPRAGVISGTVT